MKLEVTEPTLTTWVCLKCKKISPAVGIQIELSHKNIPNQDFEEIPTRRYCFYCWVKFFDENVGQVVKVEE